MAASAAISMYFKYIEIIFWKDHYNYSLGKVNIYAINWEILFDASAIHK